MKPLFYSSLFLCSCWKVEEITMDDLKISLPEIGKYLSRDIGYNPISSDGIIVSIELKKEDDNHSGWTHCTAPGPQATCRVTINPIIIRPLEAVMMHEIGHSMGLKHVSTDDGIENIMSKDGAYFLTLDEMSKQIAMLCKEENCRKIKLELLNE